MGIFATSMKGKWEGLTYVDLFAGPGLCVVDDSWEEIHGSPLLALETRTPFDVVVCVEEDDEARAALSARVRRHPRGNSVEVLPGDCNAVVTDVIAKMPPRFLSLVFIDPEGVADLDPTTLKSLGDQRHVDLIILFAQNMAINRNKWRWLSQEDTPLDKLTPEWRTARTPEVVQFMDQLHGMGFTFVESARRAFRNRRGARLYYLVFASRSSVAAEFWRKISGDEQMPLFNQF